MNFDFGKFVFTFSNGSLTNKELFDVIEEYDDCVFFTELKDYLSIGTRRSDIEVQELYSKICYAYFKTKRYFKEH